MIEAVKKKYPILDENGQSSTYPTFASQVYMEDGTTVEQVIEELKARIFPDATGVSF